MGARHARFAMCVVGVAALSIAGCVPLKGAPPPAPAPGPPPPQLFTVPFSCTTATQNFTVPSGVTSLTVDGYGAQGGTGADATIVGARGGRATATLAVTPAETLDVNVGCQGGSGSGTSGGAGGFGGGAAGGNAGPPGSTAKPGGGGGGGSDVRRGSVRLKSRVVAAVPAVPLAVALAGQAASVAIRAAATARTVEARVVPRPLVAKVAVDFAVAAAPALAAREQMARPSSSTFLAAAAGEVGCSVGAAAA